MCEPRCVPKGAVVVNCMAVMGKKQFVPGAVSNTETKLHVALLVVAFKTRWDMTCPLLCANEVWLIHLCSVSSEETMKEVITWATSKFPEGEGLFEKQSVFTFSILTQTVVGPATANLLLFIILSLHFKTPHPRAAETKMYRYRQGEGWRTNSETI